MIVRATHTGEAMKEIRISFNVKYSIKGEGCPLIGGGVVEDSGEGFLGVLKRVLVEIEGEVLRVSREFEGCG